LSAAKITVCIPAYNRPHFLGQALDSLCDQGLTRDEYVIAISDDASPNDVSDVITEYKDKLQILYHRNHKNLGHIANFEVAVGLCQTPYVSFLPDDDLIAPGQLGRSLSALEKHKRAVLVSSLVIVQEHPGALTASIHGMFLKASGETSYSQPYVWDQTEWLALSLLNTPLSWVGSVFNLECFNQCHLWKSYPLWHDRLMLAEMSLHGEVISLPWIGGYYRINKQQLSAQLASNHTDEFDKVTRLILDICEVEGIPVIEFWKEQICAAVPEMRIHYLRRLKAVLPINTFMDIRRSCEERLNVNLSLGGRLSHWGIPEPIAELLRAIERRLSSTLYIFQSDKHNI